MINNSFYPGEFMCAPSSEDETDEKSRAHYHKVLYRPERVDSGGESSGPRLGRDRSRVTGRDTTCLGTLEPVPSEMHSGEDSCPNDLERAVV